MWLFWDTEGAKTQPAILLPTNPGIWLRFRFPHRRTRTPSSTPNSLDLAAGSRKEVNVPGLRPFGRIQLRTRSAMSMPRRHEGNRASCNSGEVRN